MILLDLSLFFRVVECSCLNSLTTSSNHHFAGRHPTARTITSTTTLRLSSRSRPPWLSAPWRNAPCSQRCDETIGRFRVIQKYLRCSLPDVLQVACRGSGAAESSSELCAAQCSYGVSFGITSMFTALQVPLETIAVLDILRSVSLKLTTRSAPSFAPNSHDPRDSPQHSFVSCMPGFSSAGSSFTPECECPSLRMHARVSTVNSPHRRRVSRSSTRSSRCSFSRSALRTCILVRAAKPARPAPPGTRLIAALPANAGQRDACVSCRRAPFHWDCSQTYCDSDCVTTRMFLRQT